MSALEARRNKKASTRWREGVKDLIFQLALTELAPWMNVEC
jgi:hypothetical protein